MSEIRKNLIIAIMVIAGSGCGNSGPTPADPDSHAAGIADGPAEATSQAGLITARSMLDQAMAEARKWAPDAELAGVTTSLADGPSHSFWFYDVQSPSQGTCTRIRAMANGTITNVGPGDPCGLFKPVSAGFVDSPPAYDAARAAGFAPGDSVQFGLRFQRDQALPAPRECWVIWSDHDGDDETGLTRGWCIDPATATFVTRLSGFGGSVPR